MDGYLISAIISTYNSERFIEGKILDLLQQTIIDNLEIIIVNSGSKQNEDEIIKKYLNIGYNIKYIKTDERETIYKAWNRGIKIANGDFITNANTDDRLRKDALEILAKALIDNQEVGLVFADQVINYLPNQDFELVKNNKICKIPNFNPITHLERCLILSQPMWRSSLHFEDEIWFDEKYEICGDHDFELKVAAKYKILHIPLTLGCFYLSPKKENKSFQNFEKVIAERMDLTQKHITLYLSSLDKKDLLKLLKKFEILVQIPIPLFLLIYKLKALFFINQHIHSLEFIYFFVTVIYKNLGENKKALKVCEKFLRKRYSSRIQHEKESINSINSLSIAKTKTL